MEDRLSVVTLALAGEGGGGGSEVPIATPSTAGKVKPDDVTIKVDAQGTITAQTATDETAGIVQPDGETITIDDGVISAVGGGDIPIATTSIAGKVRPDGETISVNETGTISVNSDSEMSASSAKPIQNRVVTTALGGKVDKEAGKGLSTNDYDTNSKNKLDNLVNIKSVGSGLDLDENGELTGTGGADIDDALSSSSENPVQNKVINSALADKVDKVTGKGLSANDYSDADKGIVDGVTAALADKVDKVTGKGLSANDYTDADKTIVDGVTTALTGKVDKETGKGLSTNDYSNEDKAALGAKLTGRIFGTAQSANGTTVTFTGINTAKSYDLKYDIGSSYNDAPVSITNVNLSGTTITYTVSGATAGQYFQLIEIG